MDSPGGRPPSTDSLGLLKPPIDDEDPATRVGSAGDSVHCADLAIAGQTNGSVAANCGEQYDDMPQEKQRTIGITLSTLVG